MINIRVPSRFKIEKSFIEATIIRKNDKFIISDIWSDIPNFANKYKLRLKNKFNYSFVNEFGYHEIIGKDNDELANLLILLAWQKASRQKDVRISFSDTSLNKSNFILNSRISSLADVNKINELLNEDSSYINVWIFYLYYTIIITEGLDVANSIYNNLEISNQFKIHELLLR